MMLTTGYNGPKPNPLFATEATHLTAALGKAHRGPEHYDADEYGTKLHLDQGVSYHLTKLSEDPEALAAKLDERLAALTEIITPFVGRWAMGKHYTIGVQQPGGWELWQRFYSKAGANTMHVNGIILGVEGIVFDRTMAYSAFHPGSVSEAQAVDKSPTFAVGVLLDTGDAIPAFNYDIEAPDVDRMLVPIQDFPRHPGFNRAWSWQVSGLHEE